jgi:GTP-binding protein
VKTALEKLGVEVIPVSTVSHENIDRLLWRAVTLLEEAPEPEPVTALPVYRAEEDPKAFTVSQTEDGWVVTGKAIERAAAMTYWEHRESVRRFQRLMETVGVEEALRDAGVEEGDTVYVGEYTLEWQD